MCWYTLLSIKLQAKLGDVKQNVLKENGNFAAIMVIKRLKEIEHCSLVALMQEALLPTVCS